MKSVTFKIRGGPRGGPSLEAELWGLTWDNYIARLWTNVSATPFRTVFLVIKISLQKEIKK